MHVYIESALVCTYILNQREYACVCVAKRVKYKFAKVSIFLNIRETVVYMLLVASILTCRTRLTCVAS